MITSVDRIGTPEDNDGWFLINQHVKVKYIQAEQDGIEGVNVDIQFDESVLTEKEAEELAYELLDTVIGTPSDKDIESFLAHIADKS